MSEEINTDDARQQILSRIRSANQSRVMSGENKGTAAGQANVDNVDLPNAVKGHMARRGLSTQPGWRNTDDTERLLEQMQNVQISVTRVQTSREIPDVVAEYRRENGIDGELIVSPALNDPALMQWGDDVHSGIARDVVAPGVEVTSVTPCFCAVAETGSIVTVSDGQTPSTLNFLPDNHVVVLYQSQVVGHLEDALAKLRTLEPGDELSSPVPRSVNFLTGPSRTADIEQTLELGAHGPRKMQVILVAADA